MARYRSVPITVDARVLSEDARIGSSSGNPGDYLVTFPDGGATILSKDVFETSYKGPLLNGGNRRKKAKAAA